MCLYYVPGTILGLAIALWKEMPTTSLMEFVIQLDFVCVVRVCVKIASIKDCLTNTSEK